MMARMATMIAAIASSDADEESRREVVQERDHDVEHERGDHQRDQSEQRQEPLVGEHEADGHRRA